MGEFNLDNKYKAGKENLLADTLTRKHKDSPDLNEEQDFIPRVSILQKTIQNLLILLLLPKT